MSTREQLIGATKELLWEHGYEATSPRTILQRSGVGQGSLYHYFKGKAELAAAALEEVASKMESLQEVVLYSEKAPLERVRDHLRMPREALRGCRMGRMVQEEEVINQEMLRHPIVSYFTELEQGLEAALEQAQQEGALARSLNAADVAAMLVAVVQGGYVLARAFQDPKQQERAIHGALAILDELEQKTK